MENEVIKHYISSVMRSLPKNIRQDVAQELGSLISDMLEKRCGDVLPTERDIKVVLAELGEPWELSAEYNPKGGFLIGRRFYRVYMLVLSITLISTVFGISLGKILELFQSDSVAWHLSVVSWLLAILQGFFWSLGIVTFIFAVLERAMQYHEQGHKA